MDRATERTGDRRLTRDQDIRWRARLVTWTLVAGLLVAAQLEVEAWPITSFRLFSQVRTGRAVGLELIAIDTAGDRHLVPLAGEAGRVGNVVQQLELLRTDPVETRRAKVLAWLELVGIDPAGLTQVDLERVVRQLDPDGGPAVEMGRTLIAEVPL